MIEKLTFTWAEAVFLVSAVVGCGCAPRQVVCAAFGGACCVGFALENEGEVAKSSLCIPIVRLHSCGGRGRVGLAQCTKQTQGGDSDTHFRVVWFFTWAFSQSPELVIVKVGVSLHTLTRRVSVSQKSVLAIERVRVPVI